MSTIISLQLQQLGDQLAVCVPANIAKAARLVVGQVVTLEIPTTSKEFLNAEKLVPTLDQMLAQYDSEKFAGEVLPVVPVGKEIVK